MHGMAREETGMADMPGAESRLRIIQAFVVYLQSYSIRRAPGSELPRSARIIQRLAKGTSQDRAFARRLLRRAISSLGPTYWVSL